METIVLMKRIVRRLMWDFFRFSEDELALMRFTCDLFFVEESPLFHIDAEQKEPSDYKAAYRSLLNEKSDRPTWV